MSELRFESAGVLGSGIMGALFLTTKVERVNPHYYQQFRDAGQPLMFVCWHGVLLPLVHYHRREGVVVLVSEHDDGEYLTRVLRRNGFGTVRGSSKRGGSKGLRGLVRAARAGHDLAVTPDGPTGPPHVLKPGALIAAQMAELPVVPVRLEASSGWRFRSWDAFLVPRPLSKITIEYLQPRYIPRDAGRAEVDRLAREIADDMNRGTGAEGLADDSIRETP